MLRDTLKGISISTLAFAVGVAAFMLWVYQLPEEELGIDRYGWTRIEQEAALWWHQPHAFIVHVPPEPSTYAVWSCIKPNPLVLTVLVDAQRYVQLNEQVFGTLNDTRRLRSKLAELFHERLENRAYREGILENPNFAALSEFEKVERSVYVEAAPSLAYGEVVKLMDELKGVGADPLILRIGGSFIPTVHPKIALQN